MQSKILDEHQGSSLLNLNSTMLGKAPISLKLDQVPIEFSSVSMKVCIKSSFISTGKSVAMLDRCFTVKLEQNSTSIKQEIISILRLKRRERENGIGFIR